MDNILFSRRRAERFAQLLDEANGGRRHHVRSRADDQLAPLVAVGQRLHRDPPAVEVNPEFRTGLRAMLLATAEREGLGHRAGASEPSRAPTPTRPAALPAVTARRARARGAILIGVAAGAIAVSGISAASENAVPGDALYGMKRSTERAQLALASSDISRGQLFLDFARTRLGEAASCAATGRLQRGAGRHGRRHPAGRTPADRRRRAAGRAGQPGHTQHLVSGQRRAVSGLLDGGTRADRDRTQRSLVLLDTIRERSDALRAAIACGLPAPTASDTLGPNPSACPGAR